MDKDLIQPAISVIMPVYNAEKYLTESIESILNQNFRDFEFFVIDDRSTDKSIEIIKSFLEDSRIIFIQKPHNTGYTDSLNMAIKLARGKYIARMDADDISYENRFLRQYIYMEKHPDVIALGTFYKNIGTNIIRKNLPVTFDEVKVHLLSSTPLGHPTAFIRTSIFFTQNILYDKVFEPAEDFDLWSRISEIGKIENLPEVLLSYRTHEAQVSNSKIEIQNKAADKVILRQLEHLLIFTNKPYNKAFATGAFGGRMERISCDKLLVLKRLLIDVYESNNHLKIYDEKILAALLKNIWNRFFYSAYNYNIRYMTLVFPGKYWKITKVSLSAALKYFFKSLVCYRSI